ncbi:sulfite exporter TauE/SafE family protein [Acidovorax sp.]|uniref:sulfite exporter TauE/SafE family protein n=1 Tax=Acidovorax sp. TaxID=1872122 RepID=UPI002ACE92DA|nr:sulfite exporter TauE/SafE family protein [Acidovorax sp.]MDZ7867306.1 sulfite exporter TauE/SafE family protein [Acidovorax sp.]
MDWTSFDAIAVLAGFGVGAIVGLTGVGGGSLMTPVLIFFFGVKHPRWPSAPTCGSPPSPRWAARRAWPTSAWCPAAWLGLLCAGSIPATILALWALKELGPASAQAQRIMTTTLGFALLLTAAATLYKVVAFSRQRQAADQALRLANAEQATRPRHWSLPVLLGAVIGTLVTFTSVGAGAIGVTVLLLVYPLLPLPRVIGADIAYAVPLTLVAGLGHASLGSVDWSLLAQLLAGSLPGIWLGSRLVTRTPERLIRSALSVLLAWAGAKLIMI